MSGVVQRDYYSHAVVRPGTPVFLTGQVAWDSTGAIVGENDIDVQVAQTWRNLVSVLAEIGATTADVVKFTTYVTSRDYIPALHAERARRYPHGPLPASTLVVVAGLAEPGLLVEIEAIAVLPIVDTERQTTMERTNQ